MGSWPLLIICFIFVRICLLYKISEINSCKQWDLFMAFQQQQVLWRSSRLLSFHCNCNTSREKTVVCMRNEINKTIQFGRLQYQYYWWEWFMKYTVEMTSCGMMYFPRFIKIGTGVQAILRFCLINIRSCNVGITDGRYLRITPLRWPQVAWYTCLLTIGSDIRVILKVWYK
jgi:hypothetical protein